MTQPKPRNDLVRLANLTVNAKYAEERIKDRSCFFTMPELVEAVQDRSRYPVERAMRYRKKVLPPIFQWPIVSLAAKSGLHPLVRCWLVFRKGAVPELIYRVIAARVAEKAGEIVGVEYTGFVGRALSHLYRCTRKRELLDTLADLNGARKELETFPVREVQLPLLRSMVAATDHDPMTAAALSASWLVDGHEALDTQEPLVTLWVGACIRSTCEKALDKHPQRDLINSSL